MQQHCVFNSNLTHCILHLVEGKNKDIIKLHQDKWESSEKLNFNEGTESWTFGAIIQYTNSEMIYHHSKRFKNWFSHYEFSDGNRVCIHYYPKTGFWVFELPSWRNGFLKTSWTRLFFIFYHIWLFFIVKRAKGAAKLCKITKYE